MSKYYILEGRIPVSCSMDEWVPSMGDKEGRQVAHVTLFPGSDQEVSVSTVFLGLNHNFSDKGPPILFETMVFGGKFDGEQRRYSTYKAAEEGHLQVCEMVLNPGVGGV